MISLFATLHQCQSRLGPLSYRSQMSPGSTAGLKSAYHADCNAYEAENERHLEQAVPDLDAAEQTLTPSPLLRWTAFLREFGQRMFLGAEQVDVLHITVLTEHVSRPSQISAGRHRPILSIHSLLFYDDGHG